MHINEMTKITRDQLKNLVIALAEEQQMKLDSVDFTTDEDETQQVYTSGEVIVISAQKHEYMEVYPDGTIRGDWYIAVNPDTANDIRVCGQVLYVDGEFYVIARFAAINLEEILK